jgi:hypothetical protein
MIPWNPEALELFNRLGEKHRGTLLALGADPDEVFSDWKALIESRAAAAGEPEVEPGRVETELIPLLKSSQACPAPDAPPAVAPPPPRSVAPPPVHPAEMVRPKHRGHALDPGGVPPAGRPGL